jgi:hypothetical protein
MPESTMEPEAHPSSLGVPRSKLIVVIFLCSFLAYQLPLPSIATARYPDGWFFGADNYRIAMERPGTHPAANYQISKHPGFVALAIPLYRLARVTGRRLPEPWHENAALTFPSAVFGALNVCVAFLLFHLIGFTGLAAVMVTIFYAAGAAIWTFGSFPDTYACTTFFATVYLWLYKRDSALLQWKRLAVWHAVACFVAPQQTDWVSSSVSWSRTTYGSSSSAAAHSFAPRPIGQPSPISTICAGVCPSQ